MEKTTTVMIIDDDEDDRQILSEVLKEIDDQINYIPAANAKDALQILDKEATYPDFILLDLNMPKINGRQCLAQLKKMEILENASIIIYSTSKVIDNVEELKNLGADCFLTKPSKIAQLKQAMIDILAKRWNTSNLLLFQ
jgi:CheY-like chemotaxis protein